jgi:hypothetical protein
MKSLSNSEGLLTKVKAPKRAVLLLFANCKILLIKSIKLRRKPNL